MFCQQCGAEVPEDGGFCPVCGTPAFGTAPPPPTTTGVIPVQALMPTQPGQPAQPAPPAAPATQPVSTGQPAQFVQPEPSGYPAQPGQPAPPAPPKKSKKGLLIALGAAVLVILIVVGCIVGFNIYRSNAYNDAIALLEAGDYQQALDAFDKLGDYEDAPEKAALALQWLNYRAASSLFDNKNYVEAKRAFEALGSFEDSASKVKICQLNIDYLAAITSFDAGDYDGALDTFYELAAVDFLDASEWVDKTDYAIADEKFKRGDLYGAYQDFKELGSYEDASDRAKACTTAYPSTGETYHNGSYVSSRSAIKLDGGNAGFVSYYKVYCGSDLVSTFFLHPWESCTIEVPTGDYVIKQATGTDWFGEEIMFGDEGYYEKFTYDDGSDYFNLGDNQIVTITLSVGSSDANVDGDTVPRSGF